MTPFSIFTTTQADMLHAVPSGRVAYSACCCRNPYFSASTRCTR